MAASMEKSGASNEDIARVLAQALADSGASGEEIAKTLKATILLPLSHTTMACLDTKLAFLYFPSEYKM